MDSILPPAPQQPAAGGYAIPQQLPQQPQQQQLPPGSMPRGRPPADPEVAEQRAQRHQERRRVEGVMPKKALDSKILIYRTRRGRPIPGAKPVCTVLISELESATADGAQDPEDYLRTRLAEKIGSKDPSGVFQAVTVDRRGARITEVPPFDLSLTEDGDEEEEGEEELEEVDDGRGFDAGEPEDYDFRGQHPLPPPAGPPPPPTQIDLAAIDDVGRRNREEEKHKSNESMTMMMGMFNTMQAQAQAQAQAQQQMLLAFMQQNQAKSQESQGTTVALITALAPVIKELLTPKQDTSSRELMLPILMKIMDDKRSDPTGDFLKTIPTILGEVSKQQMALQNIAAESTVKSQASMNTLLMQQMMAMSKEIVNSSRPQPEEKEGGMASIAKIAAAVLPSLMGGNKPPEQGFEEPQQPVAALPAPTATEEPQPQPPQRRRPAKTPAPAAAADAAPEAEVKPEVEAKPKKAPPTPESRIRGCLQTIRKLESGEIPAAKRWEALKWVMDRAPAPVMAAIRAQSTDLVMQECASAVLPDQQLLTWVSDSAHIDFLTSALDDVRLLEAGQVTEAYAKEQVEALTAYQAKAAAAAAPAPKPAAAPEPAAPAPAAAEPQPEATPATQPSAATAAATE
jgi:hypothetical protein